MDVFNGFWVIILTHNLKISEDMMKFLRPLMYISSISSLQAIYPSSCVQVVVHIGDAHTAAAWPAASAM